MGLAFDTVSDDLIVVDSWNGIFGLNMKTGEKKQFVSEKTVIGSSVRKLSLLLSTASFNKNHFTESTPSEILQLSCGG